jgi:hypothetical protein
MTIKYCSWTTRARANARAKSGQALECTPRATLSILVTYGGNKWQHTQNFNVS